jgi:hypothetical protein
MTETAWKMYCKATAGGMDVACDPSQLGPNVIRRFEELASALLNKDLNKINQTGIEK